MKPSRNRLPKRQNTPTAKVIPVARATRSPVTELPGYQRRQRGRQHDHGARVGPHDELA